MSRAIYTSESTIRSLWQKYEIFEDKVVFHTHLGDLEIPFDNIAAVKATESDVKGLFTGTLELKSLFPALKIDWANFVEHVVIDKHEGMLKRLLFTPDNPSEFVSRLESALASYNQRG